MNKIETTEKYKVFTEDQAKDFIEEVRKGASDGGYLLKKAGYEYKTKKSKGEIVDDGYLVTVVKVFNDFWEA